MTKTIHQIANLEIALDMIKEMFSIYEEVEAVKRTKLISNKLKNERQESR